MNTDILRVALRVPQVRLFGALENEDRRDQGTLKAKVTVRGNAVHSFALSGQLCSTPRLVMAV